MIRALLMLMVLNTPCMASPVEGCLDPSYNQIKGATLTRKGGQVEVLLDMVTTKDTTYLITFNRDRHRVITSIKVEVEKAYLIEGELTLLEGVVLKDKSGKVSFTIHNVSEYRISRKGDKPLLIFWGEGLI
jgi:hypothetical protein